MTSQAQSDGKTNAARAPRLLNTDISAIPVELISRPSTLTVIGTQSIVDYLNDRVPD